MAKRKSKWTTRDRAITAAIAVAWVLVIGYLVPALISAKDNFSVLLGVVIIAALLVFSWFHYSRWYNWYNKLG